MVPCLLYQDLDLSLRVLRDFVNRETSRILIDSRETYQRMAEFAQRLHDRVRVLGERVERLERQARLAFEGRQHHEGFGQRVRIGDAV